MSKIILYCFILLAWPLCMQAQSQHALEASRLHLQVIYNGSTAAEKKLEQLHSQHPNDPDVNVYLGRVRLEQERYRAANSLFNTVLTQYPSTDVLPRRLSPVYVLAGLSTFYTADYTTAKQHFEHYLGLGMLKPSERSGIDNFVRDCKFAIAHKADSVEFKPEQLPKPINSVYDEFNPVVTADGQWIIFSAHQPNNIGPSGNDIFRQWPADLYAAKYNNGAGVGQPVPLRAINSAEHDKEFCLAPDGSKLVFGRHLAKQEPGKHRCSLFESEVDFSGEQPIIQPPVELTGGVQSDRCDSWPSLSPTGDTLYFCSNRIGGQGMDIYMAVRKGKGKDFAPAKNLRVLNTAGDEYDVFIHPNGKTLYWSTNGRPGFGGQDIYMSEREPGGSWSIPKNLGWPINSPNEDMDFFVTTDGLWAFYNSDRMISYGQNDLFRFQLDEKVQPKLDTLLLRNINFKYDHEDPDYKARKDLERALQWIRNKPKSAQFLIIGHTDTKGPAAYNQDLSERRAKAVVRWLINHGIDKDQLTPIGYGESVPLSDGTTDKDHAINRRVEVRMR